MSWRRLLKWIAGFFLAAGFGVALVIAQVQWSQAARIVTDPDALQSAPVALVLGATVTINGVPSDFLRDRVRVAVGLYQQRKVEKLLMTGDDGKFHADEVSVMKRLAEEAGVPSEAIETDGHGYRTYESCKRAVQVFGIRRAIIVTQRFHLGRTMYLCSKLGMEVQGIEADKGLYPHMAFLFLRELAASVKAWWDVNIVPPSPPVSY